MVLNINYIHRLEQKAERKKRKIIEAWSTRNRTEFINCIKLKPEAHRYSIQKAKRQIVFCLKNKWKKQFIHNILI